MEKKIYYNYLYDYYKELFTEKQRIYFEEYYFNDYSLKEISENYNVSRNAIYNEISKVEKKLDDYESKLKLYNNGLIIKDLIKDLDEEKKNKIEGLI